MVVLYSVALCGCLVFLQIFLNDGDVLCLSRQSKSAQGTLSRPDATIRHPARQWHLTCLLS